VIIAIYLVLSSRNFWSDSLLITNDYGLIISHFGRGLKLDAAVSLPLLTELALSAEANSYLRSEALRAIPHIDSDQNRTVRLMMNIGRSKDADIIRSVSKALGAVGAAAKPAIPMLEGYLVHKYDYVALEAFKALGEIERSLHSLSLEESINLLIEESAPSLSQTSAILLKIIELTRQKEVDAIGLNRLSLIRASLVRLIDREQPIYVRSLAVNALYRVSPDGDLDPVIALGNVMEDNPFYLSKFTFAKAASEGNPAILPFLEERFRRHRPKPHYVVWECYVNALSHQGKLAEHLSPLLLEDMLAIEKWSKEALPAYPPDRERDERSSGIWDLMGSVIYCLASLGYDAPVIYDFIIRYSDPNSQSIRYSGSNRVYSIQSLAHVPLPEEHGQRSRILNRMNQALNPDDPCYKAVCEALLNSVDSEASRKLLKV